MTAGRVPAQGAEETAGPEFTSEQIQAGIAAAISERNFDAAIALVRLLAVQDPHAAQSIVDVVTLAVSGSFR